MTNFNTHYMIWACAPALFACTQVSQPLDLKDGQQQSEDTDSLPSTTQDADIKADSATFVDAYHTASHLCPGGTVDDECVSNEDRCYPLAVDAYCNLPHPYPCTVGILIEVDCPTQWYCWSQLDGLECGTPSALGTRSVISKDECVEAGGVVVVDIGDGSTRCPGSSKSVAEVPGYFEGAMCCVGGPIGHCTGTDAPDLCGVDNSMLLQCDAPLPVRAESFCRPDTEQENTYCCSTHLIESIGGDGKVNFFL